MRAESPEAIEQHISIIPEGVAISRGSGLFGGEEITLQATEAGSLPGVSPYTRYFETQRRISGTNDVISRRTPGCYQELDLGESRGLAVEICGRAAVHELGYFIEKDEEAPTRLWLARAALDAVNGNDTQDPRELVSAHVERATYIANEAAARFRLAATDNQ